MPPLQLPNVPEISVAEFLRGDVPPGAQLVDVREREEWAAGHIPGLDRSRAVITVCRSGRRSLFSAEDLLQVGFADVRSLSGGIIAWLEAGQTVEF
jgi:rhodanese-related sulfurtransferase